MAGPPLHVLGADVLAADLMSVMMYVTRARGACWPATGSLPDDRPEQRTR
jgi:hypothetical protein